MVSQVFGMVARALLCCLGCLLGHCSVVAGVFEVVAKALLCVFLGVWFVAMTLLCFLGCFGGLLRHWNVAMGCFGQLL